MKRTFIDRQLFQFCSRDLFEKLMGRMLLMIALGVFTLGSFSCRFKINGVDDLFAPSTGSSQVDKKPDEIIPVEDNLNTAIPVAMTAAVPLAPTLKSPWINAAAGTATQAVSNIDAQANVIVGLQFTSANLSLQTAGAPSIDRVAGTDSVLLKMDNQGQLKWSRHFGGTGNELITHVLTDADGNVYIAGNQNSNFSIFNQSGQAIAAIIDTSGGTGQTFLIKLSSEGAFVFSTKMNAIGVGKMILDPLGAIILVGTFQQATLTIVDAVPASFSLTNAGAGRDIYITRFKLDGSLSYARRLGGVYNGDYFKDVELDSSGGLYICGGFNTNFSVQDTAGVTSATVTGTFPDFVAKLSPTGGLQFLHTIGFWSSSGQVVKMRVTPSGQFAVIGHNTTDAPVLNVKDKNGTVLTTLANAYGTKNIYLVRFSSEGSVIFARNFASNGSNIDPGVLAVDSFSNTYFGAGHYSNNIDVRNELNVSLLNINRGASSSSQVVYRLDQTGAVTFARSLGTDEWVGFPTSVVVDSAGDFYVGGIYGDSNLQIVNPGIGTVGSLSPMLDDSAYILKFSQSGDFKFGRSLGGADRTYEPNELALSPDGSLSFSGSFRFEAVQLKDEAGAVLSTLPSQIFASIYDVKFSASGGLIYSRTFQESNALGDVVRDRFANPFWVMKSTHPNPISFNGEILNGVAAGAIFFTSHGTP